MGLNKRIKPGWAEKAKKRGTAEKKRGTAEKDKQEKGSWDPKWAGDQIRNVETPSLTRSLTRSL